MKKFILMALCLCLAMPGAAFAAENTAAQDAPLRIVSTIFPPYDFVRQIAGENVELSMLLPPGSESHSFEPTPQDIITIQNCDVFLYIGGETDAWVNRILESMDTSSMTILSMLDMVDAVAEETVEGMEHGHEHSHGEIDPEDVHERSLDDWSGEWMSIYPAMQTVMDAADTAVWESDIVTMSIENGIVTFAMENGETSAAYSPAGFTLVNSDHGTSVWYDYVLDEADDSMPTHLLFNDHGTGGHDDAHDHEHEEGEDALPHFHMRYGSEDTDTLLAIENWSPTFFPTGTSTQAIQDTLAAHSHGDEEEEAELDEHVWTSPRNAMIIVQAISDTLTALDPANADTYAANTAAYLADLDALDAGFAEVTQNAARNTILFGDRFPFRYLADAYGLTYYAAFSGCATETEASAATIAFLIDKTRELDLPVVFTIEFSNGKIADIIVESTNAKKLELHSCHNLSKQDFEAGVSYLDLMWRNVDQLKEALQ